MYSKKIKTVVQLLIIVGIVAFASCKKTSKTEYFRIAVDSMSIQGIVHLDDSVSVFLYGYIGPTQCHVFANDKLFLPTKTISESEYKVTIEAFGTQVDGFCGPDSSFFSHEIKLYFTEEQQENGMSSFGRGVYSFYDYFKPDVLLGKIEIK